ncbi:helix-turn-helix domain-containing protein [Leucobacter sp. M11]|nr:helix-turn-helix domain-containing protein [Leucobacter sp. M11]
MVTNDAPLSAPHIENMISGADDRRWSKLLDQLDIDDLTDAFVEQIQKVPGYDPPPIPLSEIRRTGTLSFEVITEGLRSEEDQPHTRLEVATDVGVTRARAGIPIESLMTAIRLDFSILWSALTEIAEPGDDSLLVRRAFRVWHAVDRYASQTRVAYSAEQRRMHDETRSIHQGFLASLFQDSAPTPSRLALIATELDLEPEAPYSVAAASNEDLPGLRLLVATAAQLGATAHSHHLSDGLIAFWPSDERPGSPGATLSELAAEARIGLATAPGGLRDLRSSAATALELASLLAPEETTALDLGRGWARLAKRRLGASGLDLTGEVQRALDRCRPAERVRLVEAAAAFLRTGSINDSAEQLFCHRNTLANRLRRFAELTGVDVTVPEQAARIVVGWA